jgi:5-methylcytosine-specific restriction endonuclease McrA
MSQAKSNKSATQRFLKNHPFCCFCGEDIAAETREHMPPKSLFDGSHRPDKLVMPACKKCNSGTSTSDLVTSIVSRWRYETTDQQHLDHAKLVARLKKEAPEIVAE